MKRLAGAIQAAVLSAMALAPFSAKAEDNGAVVEPDKPVDAKYVGVSGGAIAGAEIVVVAQALFGVDSKWAYFTFPLLGAGGGGVGGYFLEQESVKGSVALLVGSMALIIPAAIAASAAMTYNPEEDEQGVVVEPAQEGDRFPFEMDTEQPRPKEGSATTEVEARPPILPEESKPLPKPDQESEPETEPDEDENQGPQANLREEIPLTPFSRGNQRGNQHTTQQDTVDKGRENQRDGAGAGSYARLDTPRLSLPTVDLKPSRISEEEASLGLRPALEIYIRLLKVDFQ